MTWNVTPDTWQLTCGGGGDCTISQNLSSYGLGVNMFRRFEEKGLLNELMNEWMNEWQRFM